MSNFTIKGGIKFDPSGVKKGLKSSENDAQKFSKKMGGIGKSLGQTFAVGSLVGGIKKIIDVGENVGNQAAKVGISTDAYQALQHEIVTAGGSTEALTTAMNTLRIRQSEAAGGNKTAQDSFERLGISADELSRDSLETLFEKITKGKAATGDLDAVSDLLGSRTLKDLNTTMNAVASVGMASLISQAKEAGRVLDENFIKSATEANRAIADLQVQSTVLFSKPIGNIAKTMGALNRMFQGGSFLEAIGESSSDLMEVSDKTKRKLEKLDATQKGAENAADALNDRFQGVLDANKPGGDKGAIGAKSATTQREYSSLRRIGANIVGGAAVKDRIQESMKKAADEQVNLQKEIRDNTANLDQLGGRF